MSTPLPDHLPSELLILNHVSSLRKSLQDFTVLPTDIFRRCVISCLSVIYLPTSSPTDYVRWLSFRRWFPIPSLYQSAKQKNHLPMVLQTKFARKKIYISFKLILPSVSHVQQMERSRQCALSPSHELTDSGCQHQTVSVVWTAQTSRAQHSAAIYIPGCISVWNPSKPQHRSSLENPYPSRFFLPFFVLHIKNHATKNYISKHKFLSKNNLVLFLILPSCRVIFPHPPHNSVILTVPAEFVLCINKQV